MKNLRYKTIAALSLVAAMLLGLFVTSKSCFADGFTLSPINQDKVLIPGTEDVVTITLSNPSSATGPTDYEISVGPFKMDDKGEVVFENDEDYSQIVNWVTFDEKTGTLKPNESKDIAFKIKVPTDAPAGGQYLAVTVTVDGGSNGMIQEKYAMNHLVYAEVAGKTVRKGELNSMDAPGFMFGGNITAGASVTNLGNVHARVKHTLKITPLFGKDEVFSNEDKPQENVILPGATRYSSVEWEETPSIGIFNLSYTVEFEGVKDELTKTVIICPLWLVAIIVFIICLFIVRVIMDIRHKKD